MTNRSPKRPPGSYRAPSTNGKDGRTPARRGLLDAIFAPRVPTDLPMPKIPASLLRGLVAVLSSPVLLVALPAILLLEWLVSVALGFQGPFSLFANALALPPVGTAFDGSLSTALFGGRSGLVILLGFVVFRALMMAVLTAAIVQILDQGRVSASSVSRGVRAFPVTLAVGFMNMGILTLSSVLVGFLGGGIGVLLQVAGLVAGLYLFVFAPVMAVAEGRSMPESMARSIRAARIPGAGNLLMAFLYIIPSVAILVAPGKPGSLMDVNPGAGAWIFAILTNLLHLAFLAAFAFRYLSISEDVPDAPAPGSRARRGR